MSLREPEVPEAISKHRWGKASQLPESYILLYKVALLFDNWYNINGLK
jgi:hypothetical protein